MGGHPSAQRKVAQLCNKHHFYGEEAALSSNLFLWRLGKIRTRPNMQTLPSCHPSAHIREVSLQLVTQLTQVVGLDRSLLQRSVFVSYDLLRNKSIWKNISKTANQLLNVSILSIDSTAWSQYLSLFFSHYKQTFEGSQAVFWSTNLFQSQSDLWWRSPVTSLLLGAAPKEEILSINCRKTCSAQTITIAKF